MPRQLATLSLFPGKPEPPLPLSASTQRTAQVWIAVYMLGLAHEPISDLRSLAIWSRTLTPEVSFAAPDALLLEVQGSLRLFGGVASIKSALLRQAERRRLSPQIGIAPTANGALWLARHGNHEARTLGELRSLLRVLPMTVTGWPEVMLTRLGEMGIGRIADILRLPRDGLARRLGVAYLQELDKALGREIDLRAVWELPEKLRFSTDLVPETARSELLLEAASELLNRLTADLRRCQRHIGRFEIRFSHLRGEPTVESFELLEPAQEKKRFLRLLSDRLERARLPAPVVAIELETGELLGMQVEHPDLFPDAKQGRLVLNAEMIERLRERLGPKSVYGIALAADHRPESAWTQIAAGGESRLPTSWSVTVEGRPLWLLHAPRLLHIEKGCPVYRGALSIRAGPERIESGWWDQHDVSRDYFAAVGESGEKLWIYFDNVTRRWYLHGLFG